MRRSLTHYWRSHLAVALGCGVATAVLSGALIVGDSVRQSLQDLSTARLGDLESALAGPRFVREELANELSEGASTSLVDENGTVVAPVILVPAAARHSDSGRRHQKTTLYGVDDRFFRAFDRRVETREFARNPGQVFPSAIANSTLARELGAEVGDDILLTFDAVSAVPRESLIGRQDEGPTVESLRLTIVEILEPSDPKAGSDLDRFSLDLSQAPTPGLFVPLARLQRALGQRGFVNALLARGTDSSQLDRTLGEQLTAADLGLTLRTHEETLVLESQRLVLSDPEAEAALLAARKLGLKAMPVLTYLANSIQAGPFGETAPSVPYSTVAALDPGAGDSSELVDSEGNPIPGLATDEIVIDAWAADDLGVDVGETLRLDYYEVGPHEELLARQRDFRLRAIAALNGLAVDDTLTPPYPGMSDSEDIAGWKPPFPLDFDLIGDRDEEYWDLYRAAPKAFVSAETGRELWGGRFGDLTSLRLTGSEIGGSTDQYLSSVLQEIDPAALGLAFRPVRQQALEASVGATDFSQLFLGFGFFLIIAAALLTSLLFRLGLEERRPEIGLLLAVGFPPARVRRRFLGEGLIVGGGGVILGTGGAILFAGVMLLGLRTWWLPAVGTSALRLDLQPATLVMGATITWLLIAGTIALTVRRLAKEAPSAALAQRPDEAASRVTESKPPPRRGRVWMAAGLGGGGALLVASPWLPSTAVVPATLTAGALLLMGGVATYADWLSRPRNADAPLAGHPLISLGARNAGRQRSRSVLSVAMIATACFVISLVTAFRGEGTVSAEEIESRAGGYPLLAESSVPLTADLNSGDGRQALGLDEESPLPWSSFEATPFRLRPGDDASCLNLYRPTEPRILGARREFRSANSFLFHSAIDDRANPWTLLDEPLEPGVYPAVADFASAQWILHKGLGDSIILPVEGGEAVELRLVALLEGSIFQSELLIAEEAFVELFPDRAGYGLFLMKAPTETTGEFTTALESGLDRFGFDAQASADRLAGFDAIERTYLATFQTLGGLGFLLGTLGLGIVMLRNVLERRSELAAMRAFGFRAGTLAAAVVVENATLLIAGLVIGTASGLAAAAPQLLAGYRSIPWVALTVTVAGLLTLGIVSTLFAARSVIKLPMLENL